MKKIIAISSVLAAGLLSATTVFAAAVEMSGGGPITTVACQKAAGAGTQLTNDINVNLSTNVRAAYLCDAVQASGTNFVFVGTCHTAGSVKSRTISCVYGTAASGNRPVTPATCPALAFDAPLPATMPTVTGSGATVYTSNSGGGNVSGGFGATNGALCSAAEVATTITAQAAL
jgi:hypothetical protein